MPDHLHPGDPLSLDDVVLRGTVAAISRAGPVIAIEAGRDKWPGLKPGRWLLFPGVELGLAALFDQTGPTVHADIVGYPEILASD